jgi:hypothetical protein
MTTNPRFCKYPNCTKKGAYAFNHLCNYHWGIVIDRNIKKFVIEDKFKKGI